jgi:Hypoxia induced protein conserved region
VTGSFPVIVVLALVAVLAALGLGLFSMARGGQFNARYGNKFMRLRVGLQLVAVALVLLAVLTSGR